jgi:peptidoglycan LD-endopeptidase LytH
MHRRFLVMIACFLLVGAVLSWLWSPPPDKVAAMPSPLSVTGVSARSRSVPGRLIIPVKGVSASAVRDTFDEGRVGHTHEATDILAPRGTPVLATADGVIRKLFLSKPGGLTIYQFDRTEAYAYYYAHLDRYRDHLKEGMRVKQGDVIGYVGTTGNAPIDTPHLHFAIFKLGPEKRWYEGTAINPYPLLVE